MIQENGNSNPDGIKWKKTFGSKSNSTFSDVAVIKYMFTEKDRNEVSDPRIVKRKDFFFVILKSSSGELNSNSMFSLKANDGSYMQDG